MMWPTKEGFWNEENKIMVAYELEIPDHWDLLAPTEDETEHLMIDGKFYQPDITWMEYVRGMDDEAWEGADDHIQNLIFDHARCQTECSISRIKRFSAF